MFGIALREKEGCNGFSKVDAMDLFDTLDADGAYPIEIQAKEHESVAMGFITPEAANELEFDYEASGLNDFIAGILDDMEKEFKDCQYEFKGIKIWLSR